MAASSIKLSVSLWLKIPKGEKKKSQPENYPNLGTFISIVWTTTLSVIY